MPYLGLNGFELYYDVQGEGFPVVFAHGIGGNHASWYNQIPEFAGRYRMVTFDHRGFGNSRESAAGPGRSRFVEDLAALLDHLAIEKTVLVGQSMGGGTCAGYTVRYPCRVAALVLADTLVGLKLPEELRQRMEAVAKRTEQLGQLERVLGPTFRKREPALCQLYSALASFNLLNRKTLPGRFAGDCTPDKLAASGVPILFLVGQEDALFPSDIVADVRKLVPGSRYVELAQAGHSGYFEKPAEFNTAVLRFLDDAGIR
jgi:pimeloyl-ACP methyl ester carboxylesterase